MAMGKHVGEILLQHSPRCPKRVAGYLSARALNIQVPGKWDRAQYLEYHQTLCARMTDITTRKNNDYGGATDPFKNFREFGQLGILVRMSDKWARIKTALKERRELMVADESIDDTILDLANYCLLLMAWRKGSGEKP